MHDNNHLSLKTLSSYLFQSNRESLFLSSIETLNSGLPELQKPLFWYNFSRTTFLKTHFLKIAHQDLKRKALNRTNWRGKNIEAGSSCRALHKRWGKNITKALFITFSYCFFPWQFGPDSTEIRPQKKLVQQESWKERWGENITKAFCIAKNETVYNLGRVVLLKTKLFI